MKSAISGGGGVVGGKVEGGVVRGRVIGGGAVGGGVVGGVVVGRGVVGGSVAGGIVVGGGVVGGSTVGGSVVGLSSLRRRKREVDVEMWCLIPDPLLRESGPIGGFLKGVRKEVFRDPECSANSRLLNVVALTSGVAADSIEAIVGSGLGLLWLLWKRVGEVADITSSAGLSVIPDSSVVVGVALFLPSTNLLSFNLLSARNWLNASLLLLLSDSSFFKDSVVSSGAAVVVVAEGVI